MAKRKKIDVKDEISSELITDRSSQSVFSSKIFQVLLFIVLVIAIGAAIFFYSKYQQQQSAAKNLISRSTAADTKQLITEVGKLIELPNEVPTVATVTDISKLAGQPFFANAKNGDRVLIYNKAAKAIIYRPSTNKIINVAPINSQNSQNTLQTPQASSSATPTVTKELKVEILNGTKKSGLTRTAESKIISGGVPIKVVTRGNARDDYANSIIVDITGENKTSAQKIASILGGKIENSIPDSETASSNSDIIIILGEDFVK